MGAIPMAVQIIAEITSRYKFISKEIFKDVPCFHWQAIIQTIDGTPPQQQQQQQQPETVSMDYFENAETRAPVGMAWMFGGVLMAFQEVTKFISVEPPPATFVVPTDCKSV